MRSQVAGFALYTFGFKKATATYLPHSLSIASASFSSSSYPGRIAIEASRDEYTAGKQIIDLSVFDLELSELFHKV
jgi:hypothetical protein